MVVRSEHPAGRARGGASPRAVLATMCVGYFLVLLDVTIVNVALPRIGSGLHADVSELQWVVDGYALALASLMLAAGTVGDLHGHRRVVVAGLGVFGAGSLACALAPSVTLLVAARALQGVGAALLLPGTLAIISHAYPQGGEQARAIGIWAGIGSLALPAGPLLGGALVQAFGWRSIFLINVPVVALSLLATLVFVRETRDPKGRRLDAPGAILGVLLLLLVTFAFIDGGREGAGAPAVVGSAACAALLLGAFVTVEWRRGANAMLPIALFRRPAFSVANGVAGTMNLCTLGALFVLTLYLQSVQDRSPLAAGLALVPLFAPLTVIAPLAGRLTSRIGPRLPTAAGLLVAAAGLVLLFAAEPRSAYPSLLPGFLLWGIGLGVLTPAVVAAAIAAVPSERAGLASGVNNTARQAGGAIGIAVAGAIAGQPTDSGRFISGLHAVVLGGGCLYVAAAVLALTAIPGAPAGRRRSSRGARAQSASGG